MYPQSAWLPIRVYKEDMDGCDGTRGEIEIENEIEIVVETEVIIHTSDIRHKSKNIKTKAFI